MSETKAPSQTRSRLTLVALVALFLAPVLAAVLLNSRWVDWQPPASRNYGVLVDPVIRVPDTLRADLPQPHHWSLLTVAGTCDERCAENLDAFDRIDRALGRHGEELEPILVLDAATDRPVPPTVNVITGAAAWSGFLAGQPAGPDGVYLVDPLGNLMMAFPAAYDPSAVRRDLDRLLKYSQFET